MRREIWQRLEVLSHLSLPPAAAVPDALALVERLVPGIGSMLLWCGRSGEVAGGYSTLLDMESGIAYYADRFANTEHEAENMGSCFADDMRSGFRAECLADVLQVERAVFRRSEAFRQMMAPYGIEDFARVVVHHQQRALGGLLVFRGARDPGFTRAELEHLEQVAHMIGALLDQEELANPPQVAIGAPGVALLGAAGDVHDHDAVFARHRAMLNQKRPGAGPSRFCRDLPPAVSRWLRESPSTPDHWVVDSAWGHLDLYRKPIETAGVLLVTQRLVPAGLRMFRALRDQPLSRRQLAIACGIAQGLSFSGLASRMGISRHSVITHANNLYAKLGIDGREALLNRYVWAGNPRIDPAAP